MKWTSVFVVTLEGTHLNWQFSSETPCQSCAQGSQPGFSFLSEFAVSVRIENQMSGRNGLKRL